MKEPTAFDLSFRVAVYPDEGEWLAHALEADIIGCGSTPDEAIEELRELLECQISFALKRGDLSLIQHEAPAEIVTMWETAIRQAMDSVFTRQGVPEKSMPRAKYLGLTWKRIEVVRKMPLELVPCG